MKVLIAQTSGFCDGVKRAMRLALEAAARHGGLAADGPLVHNRQAVELLALHGVRAEAETPADRPVLIRAHGIPPEHRAKLAADGKTLIDATCAHVSRNQRLAAQAAARGKTVVLAGDRDHAESLAVAGSAGPDCRIVSNPDEAETVESDKPVFLMAQTTFNVGQFRRMADILKARFPDCEVKDTICRATHNRQEDAAALARQADVLVVVGGKNSANTRRLADAGEEAGIPVFLIETAAELREEDFARFHTAAVTSGASTPGWITQEAVNRLRGMGRTPPGAQAARILHPLAESRFLTALSAGGLGLAAGLYLDHSPEPAAALASAAYVFFAHTLNRRVPPDPEARRLSLVDSFYRSRRSPLLALAWLAAGAALAIAIMLGASIALLFSALIAAATVYALPTRKEPPWLAALKRNRVPRNWPMAAGWALAAAAPSALLGGRFWPGMGAILFVFLVCLGGTLVRDLHDIASDRLMGIDTLPARTGQARSERLAGAALATAAALPFLAAAAGVLADGATLSPWLVFVLSCALVPGLGLWLLDRVVKRRSHDAVLLQAGVDGMGCLAGALAFLFGSMA